MTMTDSSGCGEMDETYFLTAKKRLDATREQCVLDLAPMPTSTVCCECGATALEGHDRTEHKPVCDLHIG